MTLNSFRLSATLLLAVVLLASCASHVKIEETWRSQSAPETTYKRLLVVAVTAKAPLREMFENILTETLTRHEVEAVPSYPRIADIETANKDQLQALAKELGADAVVITHVLSKSESTSYRYFGGSLEERVAVMTSADADSSTIVAMSAVGVAPLETDFVKGTMMTRFFDAASAEMAWSGLSKVVNDGRKADACWDFSIQLTKALAKDRLIAINDKGFRKPTL